MRQISRERNSTGGTTESRRPRAGDAQVADAGAGSEPLWMSGAVQMRSRFFFGLFALDAFEDLFAVYGDLARGVHAEPHLIAFHSQYRHGDVVADDHRFPHAPGQDQHSQLLLGPARLSVALAFAAERVVISDSAFPPRPTTSPSALLVRYPISLLASWLTDLFLSFLSIPPARRSPRGNRRSGLMVAEKLANVINLWSYQI